VTPAARRGGAGPVDAGLGTVVPVLFVLLWATGFVAALGMLLTAIGVALVLRS
jgi:hypothetical protein